MVADQVFQPQLSGGSLHEVGRLGVDVGYLEHTEAQDARGTVISFSSDKPPIPGQEKILDMVLLTPLDGLLLFLVGWLITLLLFRIYERAAKKVMEGHRIEIMHANIEVLRLSRIISACMPDVLPRHMYANKVYSIGRIKELLDEGVPVKTFDEDVVISAAMREQTKDV